jgi:acyl-CoA thioesterase
VIAIDVYIYMAAVFVLRRDEITHIAPTISPSVDFHTPAPTAEWLLLHVTDSVTGDGLVGGRARVWSDTGTLVASGGTQQLCPARALTFPSFQEFVHDRRSGAAAVGGPPS